MSVKYYHGLCQQYRGRAVEIRTHHGEVHRGIIENVNQRRVHLRPLGRRGGGLGGFGYGGFGPGVGGYGAYGYGRGYRIALGTIAALSLLPLIFW